MEEYKEVYDKWIERLQKTYYITAISILIVEIITFFALLNAGEIDYSIWTYLFLRVLCPTLINFGSTFFIIKAIKGDKLSDYKKRFLSVFECFILCETVIVYHSYFTAVLAVLILPILTSIVYGNEKLLKQITAICVVGIIPHTYLQMTEYIQAPGTYHILNFLIIMSIILVSYLFGKVIIKYEVEKNELIYQEYQNQKLVNFEILHDNLTGIYNYGAFKIELTKRVNESKADLKKTLNLAILDIDNFSEINETFGYDTGNEILKIFGKVLDEVCKEVPHERAYAARFQGEEFAILFTNVNIGQIVEIIKEIKQKVFEKVSEIVNDRNITFGTGIMEYSLPMQEEAFFEKADKALIEAKAKGRNQIVIVR